MFGVSGLRTRMLVPRGLLRQAPLRAKFQFAVWCSCWITGHVLGGLLAGSLVGWAGSHLGPASRIVSLATLGLGCLLGALHEFNVIQLPMPQLARQVSRDWMRQFHWNWVALGYGFQLGCGVCTRITMMSTYAVIGFAFACGSPWNGAVILAFFALSRSMLPILFSPWLTSPEKSLAFAMSFDGYKTIVARANALVLIGSSAVVAVIIWSALWN